MILTIFLFWLILGVTFIISGYFMKNQLLFFLGAINLIILFLNFSIYGFDYQTGSTISLNNSSFIISETYTNYQNRPLGLSFFVGSIGVWIGSYIIMRRQKKTEAEDNE